MPHDPAFKKQLHTHYFYPNPERIQFAHFDRDRDLVIESLSPADLQERTEQRFEWTENLLITHNMREKIASWALLRDTISLNKLQEKMDALAEIQEKIAIIKVNDLVGFGLIATDDIPKNTSITFYAGQFMGNKNYKQDDYSLGETTWTISAKYYRNYSAFIMHAPYRDCIDAPSSSINSDMLYLSDFDLPHEEIISANLRVVPEIYALPYVFLETIRPIKKGEFLAWDYGLGYWQGQGFLFSLVDTQGDIIPEETYRLKKEMSFFNTQFVSESSMERKAQFEQKKENELEHLYRREHHDLRFFKKKMMRHLKEYNPWYKHKTFSKSARKLKKAISKAGSFYEINQILEKTRTDFNDQKIKENAYYKTLCTVFSSLVFKN